jgi:hypothetical protein
MGRPDSINGCAPISPDYLASWCAVSGEIITRDEAMIIFAMDASFRGALSIELDAQSKREAGK